MKGLVEKRKKVIEKNNITKEERMNKFDINLEFTRDLVQGKEYKLTIMGV